MEVALTFPGSVGEFSGHKAPLKNDLQVSAFQQRVTLSPQDAGACRKERQPQRACFQASISQQMFGFSDVRRPGLFRGPQQSQGYESPCSF